MTLSRTSFYLKISWISSATVASCTERDRWIEFVVCSWRIVLMLFFLSESIPALGGFYDEEFIPKRVQPSYHPDAWIAMARPGLSA